MKAKTKLQRRETKKKPSYEFYREWKKIEFNGLKVPYVASLGGQKRLLLKSLSHSVMF